MSWLLVAIAAAIMSGVTSIFDKLLLRKQGLSDPWTYVFWPGIAGFLAVFLVPFGAAFLPLPSLLIALGAGAIFLLGVFFLVVALRGGEASVALPIIGGLAPIATYLFGILILGSDLGLGDLIGFGLIIVGVVFLLGIEGGVMRYRNAMLAMVSAGCFGLSNILKKYTFDHGSLITGLMWISIGGALLALFSLFLARVQERIRLTVQVSDQFGKMFYFANRVGALVGGLLVSIAIFLGNPALVDAVQGLKYIVIFLGAWFLLGEDFSRRVLVRKIFATLLMLAGLLWLGAIAYAKSIPVKVGRPIVWHVTFSSKFSHALGLDWRENFIAIADELRPQKMRLIAYWDQIERARGEFDFADLDWQIDEAGKRGIGVTLAIGMKVPRWPECHVPQWAQSLGAEERETALREYLGMLIPRYIPHQDIQFPIIQMWQLENEPFLRFGECPERGKNFFEKEIALLKSFDSHTPVIVTDGGEFGTWHKAVRVGDVFGTTMYRRVYPPSIGHFFGVIDYPFGPSYFRLRERTARAFTGEHTKPFVVIELQGEPWGMSELPHLSYEDGIAIFPIDYFNDTIHFARETGFSEYYLWGAEWWFALKTQQHDRGYWDMARQLMKEGAF